MSDFTTWRSLVDGEEIGVIPDSLLKQPWDEGDGTTVSDTSGNNDGTIDGANWVEDSEFEGGWKLNFDGEDKVDADNMLSELKDDEEYLIAITIEGDTTTGRHTLIEQSDAGTRDIAVGFRDDGDLNTRSDHNTDSRRVTNAGITDRTRVAVYVNNDAADDSNDETRIYLNGGRADDSDGEDEVSTAGDTGLAFGGRTDNSSDGFGGDADNPEIWHEPEDPDKLAQLDYDAQEWSD